MAITNRTLEAPDPARRSRGELVTLALAAGSVEQALASVEAKAAADYNPFHLIIADRSRAAVVWGDGETLHRDERGPGIHWVTQFSYGAGQIPRHGFLDEHVAALAQTQEPPTPARWRAILGDHRPWLGERSPGPDDAVWGSICVHADGRGYGTRSSTIIGLGEGAEQAAYHHLEGKPCRGDFVDLSAEARQLIAGACNHSGSQAVSRGDR